MPNSRLVDLMDAIAAGDTDTADTYVCTRPVLCDLPERLRSRVKFWIEPVEEPLVRALGFEIGVLMTDPRTDPPTKQLVAVLPRSMLQRAQDFVRYMDYRSSDLVDPKPWR